MRNRSILLFVVSLGACAGAPPVPTPVASGQHVAPCPDSPNCVSTAEPATDAEHHAEPFAYTGTVADAKARMKAHVATLPRTALVGETDTSLSLTFTSKTMGFVDDVEIVFVPDGEAGGRVEYRSASRVGHGDMGVNRARMEALAAGWAGAGTTR
jgi:uncharacterized protein (DUF1499 family)